MGSLQLCTPVGSHHQYAEVPDCLLPGPLPLATESRALSTGPVLTWATATARGALTLRLTPTTATELESTTTTSTQDSPATTTLPASPAALLLPSPTELVTTTARGALTLMPTTATDVVSATATVTATATVSVLPTTAATPPPS